MGYSSAFVCLCKKKQVMGDPLMKTDNKEFCLMILLYN